MSKKLVGDVCSESIVFPSTTIVLQCFGVLSLLPIPGLLLYIIWKASNKAVFRISATGVILDFTQAAEIVAKIVKKCKKVRTPLKIFEETALTKDMFTSDLEIDWFEGAAVQGNDKKAAQEKLVVELIRKGDQPREGIASCSLQHKISLSDQVFMRVWDQVGELKGSRDCNGQGMETVGELNDSLDKDDPARKQSTIEHRRSLVFSKSNVRFGRFPLICEECRLKRRPKECDEFSVKESNEEEGSFLRKRRKRERNTQIKKMRWRKHGTLT